MWDFWWGPLYSDRNIWYQLKSGCYSVGVRAKEISHGYTQPHRILQIEPNRTIKEFHSYSMQCMCIVYVTWHVGSPQLCCPVDPKGYQWPMQAMLRGSSLAYFVMCWSTWWHSGCGVWHLPHLLLCNISFSTVSAGITFEHSGHFAGNGYSLLGSQNHESSKNLHGFVCM